MENTQIHNTTVQPELVNTKRWIYLDVCKIVSIFLIVVSNVSAGAWGSVEFLSTNWYIIGIFNIFSRFGIPLFFMLLGALFLNEEKEMPIKTLFGRYLLRLATAFLLWSVINMIIYYLQEAPGGFADFTVYGFIVGVLEGAPYVHYFIFLSMSLYLLVPVLRAIAKNLTVCRYYLILWVLFAFGVPTLRQVLLYVPNMPVFFQNFLSQTINAADRISPTMVINYAGFMLLGHYIHKRQYSRNQASVQVILGFCAFVLAIFLTIYVSRSQWETSEAVIGHFSLLILVMANGFMVGAKVFLEKTWFPTPVYNSIRFFSAVTFGIFLVHDVLRRQIGRFGIDALAFTPALSIPLLSIGIFVVSAGVAYLLKKIPHVGKYIV